MLSIYSVGTNMSKNTDKNTINIVTTCNDVEAMNQDLTTVEKHISNIVRLNLIAQPLKQAYLDAMNTSSGYTPAEDVTILNNDKNMPAGVMFQSTFYNVKAALSAGYITVIKTEPSQELKDAVKALDDAQSDLTAFIASCNEVLIDAIKAVKSLWAASRAFTASFNSCEGSVLMTVIYPAERAALTL